jgi:Fe-S-cluster containining protein
MLPPLKEYIDISQEEMFSLLRSRCDGDLSSLTPDIIKETLQPYIKHVFDLPEELDIEQNIEKKFDSLNDEPITIIKEFFQYMEEINTVFKPFSPCKKSCSKCCSIPVLVSNLEVTLIDQYLQSNIYNNIYKYKEKIRKDYSKQNKESVIGEEYTGIKCPFLKNDECIIYTVRPFVCRKYITFEDDNSKCRDNNRLV